MTSNELESGKGLSKGRIEALSDGIFAFAMTLLILDLKIPKVTEELLPQMLLHLWPKFLSYITYFQRRLCRCQAEFESRNFPQLRDNVDGSRVCNAIFLRK